MDLELRTNYWSDLPARQAFKKFLLDIHGLDFTQWESCGYWDNAYTPFSYFQNGEVIANVCIYLLDAEIQNRKTKLVQISGVGTKKSWRRKGLSRKLTQIGLEWAENQHEGVFLFADEEAIPYYEHCGFSPLSEVQEFCMIPPVARRSGLIQLDSSNPQILDKIYQYGLNRVPVSNKFSVHSAKLLMFHILYTLPNKVYEIPELKCLLCFDRVGSLVNIYDIIGESIPTLEELYPYIVEPTDRQIIFHFHTDKLGVNHVLSRPCLGNNAYTRGTFPVDAPAFPFTSHA